RPGVGMERFTQQESLLGRLRRAGAIKTCLFEPQGASDREVPGAHDPLSTPSPRPPLGPWSKSRAIAQCFLRLSNPDPTLLDRVGSYEARLWRQAAQTIWTLEAIGQPPPLMRQRWRHRGAPFTWARQRQVP